MNDEQERKEMLSRNAACSSAWKECVKHKEKEVTDRRDMLSELLLFLSDL